MEAIITKLIATDGLGLYSIMLSSYKLTKTGTYKNSIVEETIKPKLGAFLDWLVMFFIIWEIHRLLKKRSSAIELKAIRYKNIPPSNITPTIIYK